MRIAATVLALYLTACASMAPTVERPVLSDRLFCGLSIPGGGTVTQADLEKFVNEVVEPRFPQGFTMWRAQGRWRGGSEEVMVLEIIHPLDERLGNAVAEIATEYRKRFQQEAVMRVMMPARMEMEE
ncbi:MAG TPA: DUF3574 domain-containing protein [Thermoanaerobaculia bacterium]|jgi:hypothetical protein|nr:DUF3574 domain-containing protein [Thermoanaerobaculia bacterium]